MKPGVGIDIDTARQGSDLEIHPPQPRRIPSSPSTPNLRSLSLSSSVSPTDDMKTPLARSPEEWTLDSTPSFKTKNGGRSDSIDRLTSGNIGRSRTMIRTRDPGLDGHPQREIDEFGMKPSGSGTRYEDEDDDETIRRASPTMRESTRRTSSCGVPLNVDTRDLPAEHIPTDRTGEPIPYSAPGNSAYPSSHRSPSTPTGSQFQPQQYSFTPSPTKTRHDQAPGSSPHESSRSHHPHLHRQSVRHHLQNHMADFLPEDVARKMQRWVQEVVVCNFDIDRGPIVERRMIGRPWGKGERANV